MPLMTRSWTSGQSTTSPTFQTYTLQAVASTPPAARQDGGVVYFNNLIYFFGGVDQYNTYYNDMWTFNSATTVWSQLSTTGTAPAARGGFAMFVYNSLIYIYGGINASGTLYSNTFTFNPTTKAWASISPSGAVARYNFAYALNPAGTSLYMFGGTNSSFASTSSIYLLNLSTPAWSVVNASGLPAASSQFGAVLVTSTSKFYMYANSNLYSFTNGGASASTVTTTGSHPGAIAGCAISVYQSDVFVYGGYNGLAVTNSLYYCNTSTNVWTNISSSFLTNARYLPQYTTNGVLWYIFGGCNSNGNTFTDNYYVTIGSGTSSQISTANPLPVTVNATTFTYGGITFTVFKDTNGKVAVRASVPIFQPAGSITFTSLLVLA